MSSSKEPSNNPYAVLRIRNFRLFLSVRFCYTFALQMQAVIIGWQMYELTGDALTLGLLGLAEAVPAIGFALYGGHVSDKHNRKTIALLALAAILFEMIALLVITINLRSIPILTAEYLLYSIVFLGGVSRSFITPSVIAMVAQSVPRELYPSMSAWNSAMWQSAAVGGPAIGGLLYGLIGGVPTYTIMCTFVLVSLVGMFQVEYTKHDSSSASEGIKESLMVGLRFVFGNQIMLSAITLDLFAVLFGGAVALLPIFANDILKVGAEGLGFLRAAPSIGALVVGLILTHYSLGKHAGKILLYAVAGFGISTILFAISTSFYLSIFLLAASGAFDMISVNVRSTILNMETPNEMRGRVSSVNSMFISSSNEIGAFESGVAARLLGTIPSVIFGGAMTLLVVASTWKLAPKLRQIDFTRKG